MKIVYVRDCNRNPYGCVAELDGMYGYSVCHPGETFKKDRAREIATGRLAVRAMRKQDVIDAVPEYVKWAFDEVITNIENYKNSRKDELVAIPALSIPATEHSCCEPEVRKTIGKPANKSEGLLAMAKGWFSGVL